MAKLLVLADGLTGSLDVGVQFAAQGISTKIIPLPERWEAAAQEVVALNTSTRHLPPREAGAVIARLAARAAGRIPYLFKKTDSALRGNIGAELEGALRGARAGVNATLGLPIIRTSVDHGTGFGHAGSGQANALSLTNAIDCAIRMAGSGQAPAAQFLTTEEAEP